MELLVKLCGRKAFVDFERFLKVELSSFANKADESKYSVYSYEGDWFPSLDSLFENRANQTAKMVDDDLKARGVNREARRQVKKTQFKNGSLRSTSIASTDKPRCF